MATIKLNASPVAELHGMLERAGHTFANDQGNQMYLTTRHDMDAKGHVRIELLDNAGNIVDSLNTKGSPRVSQMKLNAVADAGSEGDQDGGVGHQINYNVSPDNFSSGALVFHISGKINQVTYVDQPTDGAKYRMGFRGNGAGTITIPFSVEP